MQFTGTSILSLPQVNEFSFSITGIKIPNTGLVSFSFQDTGAGAFTFTFSGNRAVEDKVISTCNSIDENVIDGYFRSGTLAYQINGIFNSRAISFSKLSALQVSVASGMVFAGVSINSNPINYSLSMSPNYMCYGDLTGTITSDTAFQLDAPSFIFYGSNKPLLSGEVANTGLFVNSGTTSFSLSDADDSFIEYLNNFFISFPASFGEVSTRTASLRTGITNQTIIYLSSSPQNVYHQDSLFAGSWDTGIANFSHSGEDLAYNLNFSYGLTNYVGDDFPSTLDISFLPLNPTNGSQYEAMYVTGLNMVSGGQYSGTPTVEVAEYFYVTGLQNSIQSFLFSSGCLNSIDVSFVGGNPDSEASGKLILRSVYLSGVYGTGIQYYNVVSGYSGIDNGWAYKSAPTFHLTTGGACYSLPDYSGVETSQFKKATGYGAVYMQAGGLTGIAIMSGSGVSSIQVTNIGFGYSDSMPPTISFTRASGDILVSGASGDFLMKNSGDYNFNDVWNISYNFGKAPSALSGYAGFYSGSSEVVGAGELGIVIYCTGLDNTAPISGLLSIVLSGNGQILTGQKIISQSRSYDLDTGAMYPNSYPVERFYPLDDLTYLFSVDQFDSQYQSDGGAKVDNIINF